MATPPKNTAVVGGSIAGLMAAVALRSAGHRVTVLERTAADEFCDRGSGLGIRPEVIAFFEQYDTSGVLQHLNTFSGTGHSTVLNKDGSVASKIAFPAKTKTSSWNALVRGLKALFDAAENGAGEYRLGVNVTAIEEDHERKGKLTVIYEENQTERQLHGVDLVVGADGASSTVRKLMVGDIERKYAGYVFHRGRVQASAVGRSVVDLYTDSTVVQTNPGCSTISYFLPSKSKETAADIMLGYYTRYTPEELQHQLLGINGHQHTLMLPRGQLRPEAFGVIKQRGREQLCPQMLELLDCLTEEDVITQVITDLRAESNCFMHGRVLIVSEAAAVLRPHAFAGTSQAAFHALRLADLAEGRITVDEWSKDCLRFSEILQTGSAELGEILMGEESLQGIECWQKQFEVMGRLMGQCAQLGQKLGKVSE